MRAMLGQYPNIMKLDETDLRLLRLVQSDASLSMDAVAERAHLSRNACWRRLRAMEAAGVITGRVALVDAARVGLGLQVLVQIRTSSHDETWMTRFKAAIRALPEITAAHRMSGDLDYVLRVQVADVAGYDRFYKKLITAVPVSDISASFVMETLKETTALPV